MGVKPVTLAGRHVRMIPLEVAHAASLATRADIDDYVDAALRERDAGVSLPFATTLAADGRIRHSVYFSITREEWPAISARLEPRLAAPKAA